ncbi:unnamed protein product [Withania somnifera]
MEKLREAIVKLCNSEPNAPLSATKNSILHHHLTNFLSNLHITPDHPPYAWMIEKALQELDEKGGSTEDSIAKFLKKEYESLPWAHMTLLKHHLQKMSENGEIVMIDGGRFLLPGDSESSNRKRKRRRKYLRRKRRGNLEIKKKKPQHKEKEEEEQVQHDDVEVVGEQKDLGEQLNEVTVNGNRTKENSELNGPHNELSTDKDDRQLGDQQNSVSGNKVFYRRVQRNRVHKEKGKEQLDATEGSLQSSVAIGSHIGCNSGSVPTEPSGTIMIEEIEHLQDSELQQPKLSITEVEETADISNLYPQEILENEQPGDNVPQLLSPEAPPGYEFMVVEGAAANKAHTSSSVGYSQKESVAKDLLKTKKHNVWQQTNMPTRALTRAQSKTTETSKSSGTDRAQRQLKRWSKNPGEPKPVSTSKEDRLLLCDSVDQHLAQMEEPLSLVSREELVNLIDPQHEVHSEQPKEQHPGRLPKYKEDVAKIDNSTNSELATNKEVLCLDDSQDGVHLKQPKDKHRGRYLKGKEDGDDPDTTLLKDLGLPKKLTKKQNNRGLGRRRNAQ